MKKRSIQLAALTLSACLGVAQAATITVTTATPTGPGSLTAALLALNDGDTVAFNIPGAGPHYLQTPPGGWPLVIKDRVTIDGYTQPGSARNTNPNTAANNAVLKIVLDSRNGNYTDMRYDEYGTTVISSPPIDNSSMSTERAGYTGTERATLGVYRGTNVNIRGLCFLGDGTDGYSIAVAHDYGLDTSVKDRLAYDQGSSRNCHINGCWFGVNPTNQTPASLAIDGVAVAFFRHREASPIVVPAARPELPNESLIFGVAPGSANPRAEANVSAYMGYVLAGEGIRTRAAGNFIGVLPDGVTPSGVPAFIDDAIEVGRYDDTQPMVFGTDGDGVNDADEGNLFGPMESGQVLGFYSFGNKTYVVSGNRFGIGVDGTRWTNAQSPFADGNVGSSAKLQFGSDFDGVSDALEGNVVYNNYPFDPLVATPPPTTIGADVGARVSVRGNTFVNNSLVPYSYADGLGGRLNNFTNYSLPYMNPETNSIIPSLDPTSVYPNLKGTFAVGTNGYTTIIVDIYQLDQEGWNNGKAAAGANSWSELTDGGTYTNGFAQGSKYLGSRVVPNTGNFNINLSGLDLGVGLVTVTVNYSLDPAGTHNGRVHTGNFSSPVALIPGGADSVGLTRIVPDTIVWMSSADNTPRIGNFVVGTDIGNGGSVEASAGVLGDSTFLLAASMKADDGTSMRLTSIYQPAAGGTPKLGDLILADNGTTYTGQINNSRQDGNPGRIAGDPRYGAVNFIGAGEASLWAYPAIFNSDGRFSKDWYSWGGTPGVFRAAFVQTHSLNPATLTQTMLSKAQDSAFGRLPAGTMPGAGADGSQLSRTGGTVVGLDNGNFVSVVEDRSRLLNPGGNSSTATIFASNGSVVKESFKVANGDQWANVGAFKGGFYVRPSGGSIYFYDNAGNLQGSLNHNATSGLSFDNGRGDGTRTCSDIRSHYVFMAGRAPDNARGPVWLAVFDANTRTFVTKAPVSDTDPDVHALDRVNIACDALNRVCVTFRVRPIALNFGSQQIAARVLSFDGTSLSYLTHSFFPFTSHDSVPDANNFITQESWPAMTTREIFIYAEGSVSSTNNPAGPADTAAQTHVYTVLTHPAPVAAPRPVVTVTKSGGSLTVSWNPDHGLFTVQTRSSVASGLWANATAGNVAPPVVIPAGEGPLFVRLAR